MVEAAATARAGNVIPFPKAIKRGRKRVSRYVETGGGELALFIMSRAGEPSPQNVERLTLVKDYREHDVGHGTLGITLAVTMFTLLDKEKRDLVRHQLRHAAFSDRARGDLRAASAVLLDMVSGPHVRA